MAHAASQPEVPLFLHLKFVNLNLLELDMSEPGYVFVWRKLQDHPLWKKKPWSEGQLWADLIMSAVWEQEGRDITVRGQVIHLNRGQVAISLREMAEKAGWTVRACRTTHAKWKSDTQIDTRTGKVTSIISITNYDQYQPGGTPNDTRNSEKRHTERHTTSIKKNKNTTTTQHSEPQVGSLFQDSEGKASPRAREDQGNGKDKARGTLDELAAYAVELGMPASDGETAWLNWEENGWRRGTHKIRDWKLTMQLWKRCGYFESQKAARPGFKSRDEKTIETVNRMIAEERAKKK